MVWLRLGHAHRWGPQLYKRLCWAVLEEHMEEWGVMGHLFFDEHRKPYSFQIISPPKKKYFSAPDAAGTGGISAQALGRVEASHGPGA